jgi:hypothetical protein
MSTGANGLVFGGYRGIADIDGTLLRFADANITARQEIEAPDLVSGDWDRDAYTYGKIEIGGSISGPVTETFLTGATSVIQWGAGRDDSGDACGGMDARDIHLYYYCNRDRLFEGLFVNTLNFSVAAGEVAQFSLDVIGSSIDSVTNGWGASPPPHFTDAEKLLTWDKVSISIVAGGATDPVNNDIPAPAELTDIAFSNFEFTVNNNVETVYGIGQPNLLPFDIVPGIRQISGTLSVYNAPDFNGAFTFEDYCADGVHELQFGLNSLCTGGSSLTTLKVRFHRVEPTLNTGVIVSTVGFTGVTHQSGFPWDLSATP